MFRWTPDTFWGSTPHDFNAAYDMWYDINVDEESKDKVEPLSRAEFNRWLETGSPNAE